MAPPLKIGTVTIILRSVFAVSQAQQKSPEDGRAAGREAREQRENDARKSYVDKPGGAVL